MKCNFTDISVRCMVVRNRHTIYTHQYYTAEPHNFFQIPADEPPKVTDHPKSLKDAVLYEPVTFCIKATGTEPLYHQWEHKTRDGSGEWQSCDLETFPGANSRTLTIPSVQKSNEGSYRCTVSNLVGSETSEYATLTLGELNILCNT